MVTSDVLWHVWDRTIPSAMAMLPGRMDTPEAKAMLLAIGLQESRFRHRVQVGGPAHGFWQFESGGGIKGVLAHASSRPFILPVCATLCYPAKQKECYEAVTHNDTLACVFARLLLWTVPGVLPTMNEPGKGWAQYLSGWRPGKPHPSTWSQHFSHAWTIVTGG